MTSHLQLSLPAKVIVADQRYLESDDYRRRINAQLNKGESLHGLRRYLFFAEEGRVRRRHVDEQANHTSCLNLVVNAVIKWNTVYMAAALEQLRVEGVDIADDSVAHLSPALSAHVNPYGRYRFDTELVLGAEQLRPLRAPDAGP